MEELEYKEIRVDHSRAVNTSEILKKGGFSLGMPIHTRKDYVSGETVYSQAVTDMAKHDKL